MAYEDLIEKHFRRVGLDPIWGRQIARVESDYDPKRRSPGKGTYKGLFQLDEKEFKAHGGSGSIFDPEQNTMAAANKIAREKLQFEQKHGRPAKLQDIYMIHQQGQAGYDAHMANPDKPAWENVRKYYKSDEVAKKAIWGNMTSAMKAKYGSVENVKSGDFTGDWSARVAGQTLSPSQAKARAKARREAIPEQVSEVESRATEPTRGPKFDPVEPVEFNVPSLVPNIQLPRLPR